MTYAELVPVTLTLLLWLFGTMVVVAVPLAIKLVKDGATSMLGKGGVVFASLLIGAIAGALVAGAVYLFYVQPTNAEHVQNNVEYKYNVTVSSAQEQGDSTYRATIVTTDKQARNVEVLIGPGGEPTLLSTDSFDPKPLER